MSVADDTEDTETNEILAAARDAKAIRERAAKKNEWPIAAIGLGVGVGSAAIAAAMLYASRSRGKRDD